MKQTFLHLNIPNPCTENWEEMSVTEKGKFCSYCQHEVTDFTNLSNAEIIHFLSKTKGKVCGRVRSNQLNRRIIPIAPVPKSHWGKWVASLLLLSTANEVVAQNAQQTHIVAPQSLPTHEQATEKPTTGLPKNTISGKVFCNYPNKYPIDSAKIYYRHPKGTLTTYSNCQGEFALIIPDEWLADTMFVAVSNGVESWQMLVKREALPYYEEVSLAYLTHMGGMMVAWEGAELTVIEQKKWWQFWK